MTTETEPMVRIVGGKCQICWKDMNGPVSWRRFVEEPYPIEMSVSEAREFANSNIWHHPGKGGCDGVTRPIIATEPVQ